MKRYGYIESGNQGYPLAAWIWGHRLRIGQDWMEYLLEFLNVLAGFDYELGQGINDGATKPSSKEAYERFTRLGLRRFVFYHEREKTRHPFDDHAHELLLDELDKHIDAVDPHTISEPVVLLRSLLQAFSAVEAQRSWYAKSLFPAHHNLLFWEALRKGATKYKGRSVPAGTSTAMLDEEIKYDQRNFFARGGEVYYLILSAGTEKHPKRRQYIASRLREILVDHNQALGQVADIIDRTWIELSQNGSESSPKIPKGKLGWIPAPDCAFYEVIAEDVFTFLHADLDSLELLDLLAHLMGFHLSLYIYLHAHEQLGTDIFPILLVDAMDGADSGIIRSVSASLYSEQEARIIQRGREYVAQQVQAWASQATSDEDFRHIVESEARISFNLTNLHKRTRRSYDQQVNDLLEQLSRNEIDQAAFLSGYTDALTDLLLNDFRKNFLGVHRKLAKAVDFVAPRKGRNERFVLGDNLLKVLTLANLKPGASQIYSEFLSHLQNRYGLVVGPDEARKSGLFERHPINESYYRRNKDALLVKMKHGGLAIEYSDATAMVTHPLVQGGKS